MQQGKFLAFLLAAWCANAHALGLGELKLNSSLGAPLQASVEASGIGGADTAANLCLKSRLETLDGRLLALPRSTLIRDGESGRINIRTREAIEEPAANLSVEIGCGTSIRREFAILLDPAPATPVTQAIAVLRPAASAKAGAAAIAETKTALRAASNPQPLLKSSTQPASVLRLSSQTGTQEQAVPEIPRLKFSDTLSEPRIESDPAKLEAMRADQARVAALLRGENPVQAADIRAHQALAREQAMRREAQLAKQQSTADRQALEAEKQQRWSTVWIVGLGSALLAAIAAMAWLLSRNAKQKQAMEQSFLASLDMGMDNMQEARREAKAQPLVHAAADEAAGEAAGAAAAEVGGPSVASSAKASAISGAVSGTTSGASQPWLPPLPEPTKLQVQEEHNNASGPLDFELAWQDAGVEPGVPPDNPTAAIDAGNDLDWLSAEDTGAPDTHSKEMQAHAAQVAQLLLAVEAWMADHNPLRAIGLLEPYCASAPATTPAPALYLLELYRIIGEENKYRGLSERIAERFQLAVPGWEIRSLALPRQSIADFPDISGNIAALHGSDRLLPYLQCLLLGEAHFDFSTYRDIMQRIAELTDLQPERDIADMSLDFHHG